MFDRELTPLQSEVEDVPTSLAVLGQKVQVIARHIHALGVVGKAKADERVPRGPTRLRRADGSNLYS